MSKIYILIIEDEVNASKRLIRLIEELSENYVISETLESVSKSIEWLEKNKSPDLIFMDIQLSDGISFEIFEKVKLNSPVIFTTAYDQYAIEAFRKNAIDYLLKPIKIDELKNAVEKFEEKKILLEKSQMNHILNTLYKSENKSQIVRFKIQIGAQLKIVQIEQVAYFNIRNKMVYLTTNQNERYPVDFKLEELEDVLDPKTFFRINRQYIVSIYSIRKMLSYSKSRVKLILEPETEKDEEVVTSVERSAQFKRWLEGHH